MKIHILLLLFYYFASTITEISQCWCMSSQQALLAPQ